MSGNVSSPFPSLRVQPLIVAGLLLVLCCVSRLPVSAQTFADPGFTVETVANLPRFNSVGLTFATDGRMFVWVKTGQVRIVKSGALLPTPFIDLGTKVNQVGDRGLIGLALDPKFSSNGYVYLLYVYEEGGNPTDTAPKTARLTRVKADPANPDLALAGSEVVLLGQIGIGPCGQYPDGTDCMGSDSSAHTVGTVRFAPDGKLYVGMGDGAAYTFADVLSLRSQNLNTYNGKILRINADGTAPSDNPFYDGTNSIRSKVFAYGLRSPYRFAIHPVTGEVIIGDVGSTLWEELNRGRGANFGWPCYEGNGPNTPYQNAFPQPCQALPASSVTPPIYTYSRGAGAAIVGGLFYTGTQFPDKYRGNFFFADYVNNFIRRVVFDTGNNVVSVVDFATNIPTPVAVEPGPDGSLYYISIFTGEVRRIRYSGNLPVASATASIPAPSSPNTVAFSSNGSSDPAGSALTYRWEFGDGTTATVPNPVHTYTISGVKTFTVKLSVTNTQGVLASATVEVIVGSRPPVAQILSPGNGVSVSIGDTVTFRGSATDPDETLTASALSWNVLLHHNDHIHPGVTAVGATGSFVVENHGTGETYFYEIVLTATDSSGLTDTKRINIYPLSPTSTLPAPWVAQEVGNVAIAGSAAYSGGTFTILGSGADITDFSDGFYYAWQPLSGDGEIIARVVNVQTTSTGAKAGVMIRESLAANAAHALMSVSPIEGLSFERRDATGFGTALLSGGYFAAPYWVRLARSGNMVSAYQSGDGFTWKLIGSAATFIPSNALIGLAVTSANNAALCTATFDNVTINKVILNQPPTVSLTSPVNGATFNAPAAITLNATAADSDGSVSKVEFFRGTTLLGTATTSPYSLPLSNAAAGTYQFTARATDNKGAVTTSSPITVTVNNVVIGTGNGLEGSYYKKTYLSEYKFTRTDPTVNFDWGTGVPDASLRKDEFSVRWTGFVQPRFSGTYTFYLTTSDGVQLWVNGQQLVDFVAGQNALGQSQGTIGLQAGQKYEIVLEFYQPNKASKRAAVKLEWSGAQQAREVIPKSQLYTP